MTDAPSLNEPIEQGERPEFDLTELSWADSIDAALVEAKLRKLGRSSDAEKLAETFNELHEVMAKVTVSVPRSWLVKRAPEGLSWSDPESFKYLRASRMRDLIVSFKVAQTPGEASGN